MKCSTGHLWCRVEDGLINHESPFCGSKRFGISHVNSQGHVSQVGTLLKIEGHRKLPDGQITTFNRGVTSLNGLRCCIIIVGWNFTSSISGVERYKIRKITQKHPILIAEVEMMAEEDDTTPKVSLLP